jgi:hypothetical protein
MATKVIMVDDIDGYEGEHVAKRDFEVGGTTFTIDIERCPRTFTGLIMRPWGGDVVPGRGSQRRAAGTCCPVIHILARPLLPPPSSVEDGLGWVGDVPAGIFAGQPPINARRDARRPRLRSGASRSLGSVQVVLASADVREEGG